jgi:hypothetical protein
MARLPLLLVVVLLTLLSGLGDSQGFVHAARIWQNGQTDWQAWLKSAAGFAVGIAAFWLAVRYMTRFGLVAPEIQAVLWFAVAIIGVAAVSGQFFRWQLLDQAVALVILAGLGWLVFRTGG